MNRQTLQNMQEGGGLTAATENTGLRQEGVTPPPQQFPVPLFICPLNHRIYERIDVFESNEHARGWRWGRLLSSGINREVWYTFTDVS
jgi:hypothetical protein